MSDDLLSADFIRNLEALKRRLLVRARSGRAGDRTARRRGGTAEFAEHRPYAPGDDLRHLDWLAYARSGQPLLKVFHAEEDVLVRLLVDGSASLGFGTPSKFDVARKLAAAAGYLAVASSERAQVLLAQPSGASIVQMRSPRRGSAALPSLLSDLSNLEAKGSLDLPRAIDHVVRQSARPGVLLVISDFLDRGPVLAALTRAAAAGHDLRLVQVLAPEELSPGYEGDLTLVDSETSATMDVTVDADAVNAYVVRLAALVDELRGFARRHGAGYVRAVTDEALEPVMRRFVERVVD